MPSPPITASQSQGSASRSRPSTKTCFGVSGSACTARASAHSEARKILSRSIRAGDANATAKDEVAQIFSNSSSRSSAVSRLESSMPFGMRSGSRIDGRGHHRSRERTAAGLVAARHRPDAALDQRALAPEARRRHRDHALRQLGLSLFFSVFFFASRIMPGSCASRRAARNRELEREDRLSPLSTAVDYRLTRQSGRCTRRSSPTSILGATTTSQGWPSGSAKYPE